MRLLDKYIGREVASHSLLGLAVFTFVFFVPQLVRLMDLVVRHSGGVGTVSLIFLCSLTPVLAFTVPMAVLVGVLYGVLYQRDPRPGCPGDRRPVGRSD